MKKVLVLSFLILLGGCSWTDTILKDDPEVGGSDSEKDVMVCRVPLDVQAPSSIPWTNPKFYVLNKEKMEKIVNGESPDMPDVYIALTAKGYENLTYNMNEMRSIIEQQRNIIKRQQEYYSKDENENDSQQDTSKVQTSE